MENYPFGLRAIVFYRPLNVETTLETWHGLGHQFPPDGSPALKQWLALEAHPERDHKPAAQKWMTTQLDHIKGIPNPVDQWVALRDLKGTPYLRALGSSWKTKIEEELKGVQQGGRVALEAKALEAHRSLLRKEMSRQSEIPYQSLIGAYLKLSQEFAGTRQAEIAHSDYERVLRLQKHFNEQARLAKENNEAEFAPIPPEDPFPKAPTNRPTIPTNPLIR